MRNLSSRGVHRIYSSRTVIYSLFPSTLKANLEKAKAPLQYTPLMVVTSSF